MDKTRFSSLFKNLGDLITVIPVKKQDYDPFISCGNYKRKIAGNLCLHAVFCCEAG